MFPARTQRVCVCGGLGAVRIFLARCAAAAPTPVQLIGWSSHGVGWHCPRAAPGDIDEPLTAHGNAASWMARQACVSPLTCLDLPSLAYVPRLA